MTFVLGKRSIENLKGVHPDLVKVVELAITLTSIDFTVIDGLRTAEEQAQLFAKGASRTLNSKHLKQKDGYAHAVDVCVIIAGRARWDVHLYEEVAHAFFQAATKLNVAIEWGGAWRNFKDYPHFQLKGE